MQNDVSLSPLFSEQLIYLSAKNFALNEEISKIETLALGASHGDFSFNPRFINGSFNLCTRSQDLKHSYYLLKALLLRKKLKNIVLYYSLFSPGSNAELMYPELEVLPVLNELFKLGLKYESEKCIQLSNILLGKLDKLNPPILGFSGFYPDYGKDLEERYLSPVAKIEYVKKRALGAYKLSLKTTSINYLESLIYLTKQYKINLLIVISPARSDFRAINKFPTEILYKPLYDILNKNIYPVSIFNAWDSVLMKDEYFRDCDHLCPKGFGTTLLSRIIAGKLE